MTTATRISELFGSPKQAPITPKISRPYTTSGTFTAPANGWVTTMQMGGGGGGGCSGPAGTATGGSSAAWAGKLWRVTKGQVLTIAIGAGGAYGASGGAAGGDGGATTITDGVATVTSPGGFGGPASLAPAALTGPNGGAAPTNADIGAAGSKAGNCAAVAGARTGGAGVDLFAKGGNATRSGDATGAFGSGGGSVAWHSDNASATHSAGAGYGGPSVGSTAGPGLIPANPSTLSTDPNMSLSTQSMWGIPHFGGGCTNTYIQQGGGGSGGTTTCGGGFGGGGGGVGEVGNSYGGGAGGFGAGGGGGGGTTQGVGTGGGGYVWLEFVPEGAV